MDKKLEKIFLGSFRCFGVVSNCIEWIRIKYNLPYKKPQGNDELENIRNKKRLERICRDMEDKDRVEKIISFNKMILMRHDSMLMDEIEKNLKECNTEYERKRYLFSLLAPFGEPIVGCGIADIFHPEAEIKRISLYLNKLEQYKEFLQTRKDNKPLYENGDLLGTPKELLITCDRYIKECKENIDWVLCVSNRFIELTGRNKSGVQENMIEYLRQFKRMMYCYANRLDALLIMYGIDLMRLQEECNIYLKSHRSITDVSIYIGSTELAQKYINALPQRDNVLMPKELNTDEARKWLHVAINGGLLNADYSTTDKTRTKPQKALLAEILSDKIGLDHKYKPFETLWNVSGLSKSRYKSKEEKGIVKGGNVIIEVFKEK